MRLIKFLNEIHISDDEKNEILQKCKPFLSKFNDKIPGLWRGFSKSFISKFENPNLIKLKTLKDRNPADSTKELHDLLNYSFDLVFNKKLRSESIFCTGDMRRSIFIWWNI